MFTQQFFVEGLGCASYIVGCEAKGIAAVIDPDREIQKYLDVAASRGLNITHIIETHLHADHVSGNTDLAARTGADIYVHEASGAEYQYKPLKHDGVIELGNKHPNGGDAHARAYTGEHYSAGFRYNPRRGAVAGLDRRHPVRG